MRIICPKCATEYFLDAAAIAADGTAVQCSACEHSFTVYGDANFVPREEEAPAPAPPAPAPPAPAPPAPAPPAPAPPAPAPPAPAPPAPAPPAPAPPAPAPPAPPAPAKDKRLFLAQGERVYKVKDLPTLQRWIVEKRVLPTDRMSEDGENWQVVSQRSDLKPFFAVIEQIKSAKRQLRQREREVREVAQRAVQALASASSEDLASSLDSMSVRDLASGALDPDFGAIQSTPMPAAKDSGVIREATAAMQAMPLPDADSESIPIDEQRDSVLSTDLPEMDGLEESHFGEGDSAASVAPSWSGSGPVGETRANPVLADLDPPASQAAASPGAETGQDGLEGMAESAFWSGAGWEGPVSERAQNAEGLSVESGISSSLEAASEANASAIADEDVGSPFADDFDADQEFEDWNRGGKGFSLMLVAGFALGAVALWYFLMGPGKPSAEEQLVDASGEVVERSDDSATQLTLPGEPSLPETPAAGDSAGASASSEASVPAEPTKKPLTEAQLKAKRETEAAERKADADRIEAARSAEIARKADEAKRAEKKLRAENAAKAAKKADHFAAGERQFELGNYSRAAESYKSALKVDSGDFKAAKQLGWSYIELGQAGAARSAFSKAVSIRRSSAEAHYGLGLAYDELGEEGRAKKQYEKALNLAPNGPDAPELRALISRMD